MDTLYSTNRCCSAGRCLVRGRTWLIWLNLVLLAGCNGRSIKVDNPVFTEAPPRRSLVNHAADAEEQRLTAQQSEPDSGVQPVGFSRLSTGPLTGTSVVAQINGKPVFLDDVLGGARHVIERDPSLTTDQHRQMAIMMTLRKRLPKHVEDELIVQALEKKIPADKRKLIAESLEPQFRKVLDGIKEKEGFVTDQQMSERLATEGLTIDSLRDNFARMQMIEGYVSSLVKVPETVDRAELLQYYKEHISDYTPDEEVRFSEIVIRFSDHGGRTGAEQVMSEVVTQLQSGKDFGDVALTMSDTLSGEKRGEIGWIKRGALTDKALEEMLFQMPKGQMSSVQVREDRFEVYKVTDRRDPGTQPFQEVQTDIERQIVDERKRAARAKIRREIRAAGHVETILGETFEKDSATALQ